MTTARPEPMCMCDHPRWHHANWVVTSPEPDCLAYGPCTVCGCATFSDRATGNLAAWVMAQTPNWQARAEAAEAEVARLRAGIEALANRYWANANADPYDSTDYTHAEDDVRALLAEPPTTHLRED